MANLRKHGSPPYKVALLHGGPGGAGEMALLSKSLSSKLSVLEPLQTKYSVGSQVTELKEVIEKNSDYPITLVGYSWGAWLAFIFTAQNPSLVKKLILVGSGPFEAKYAKNIMQTRLGRMSAKKKKELNYIMDNLSNLKGKEKDMAFQKVGKIISKADSYKPLPHPNMSVQAEIFERVWPEAAKLRESGELLSMAEKIKIPVVAIHGDYDPHPAKGVKKPLSTKLNNFKFILLKNCGHTPWHEKEAKDKFLRLLIDELK